MIYKAVDFLGNTKDIDMGKRTAILKYATYGSLDRDTDRANKGMFTKSWNESFNDIRFFLNHNVKEAPGRPIRFWEDANHAYAEVKLGTHSLGEDTLKMMDEGIITNNSYGFDPIVSTQIPKKGKDFKEVKLWEISVLTHWGAHPDSTVESVVKSADVTVLKSHIMKLESFIRNTTATDETIQEIIELKNSTAALIKKYDDTAVTPEGDVLEGEPAVSVEKEFADALSFLTIKF